MKLCFLDTETTGLINGRLVQLAYEIYDSESPADGLPIERKYKPPVPIGIEAMAIHHITEKMVADCGPFNLHEIGAMLEHYILVAHNAPFDIGILKNEGVETPKYWIDTKKVAQHYLDLPAYNLQYLRYAFGLEVEAIAHDALGDIAVLKAVFFRLFEEALAIDKISGAALMTKLVNISLHPMVLRRFNFGKYKGKLVDEVAKCDLNYFRWLRNHETEKPLDQQDQDLIFTLSVHL